jgi:SAM-dependent methyltransferase
MGKCLNVGCGERPIPGAVNIDPNPGRGQWRDEDWDVHKLPCEDESFDVVVSNHVLQALRDPVLALREMTRVLCPGGVMAHVVPDHRFAPLRRDERFPFQYMWNEWKGPGEFLPVIMELEDEGLLDVMMLESFKEFAWSFRVIAVRRAVWRAHRVFTPVIFPHGQDTIKLSIP